MKQPLVTTKLIVLAMITPLNIAMGTEWLPALPLDFRQDRLLRIEEQVEKRWEKVKEAKEGNFALYKNKTDDEIKEEFRRLNNFRNHLWYRNPENMPLVNNPDYKRLNIENDQWPVHWLAFDYNHVDDAFNASTILIYGHHFIALKEPVYKTVDTFFEILVNHDVEILVRLKPEGEYEEEGSFNYWEDKLVKGPNYSFIQPKIMHPQSALEGAAIPYFYTNNWIDNLGINLNELYKLVQAVRKTYEEIEADGPIACHCAAGIGRTGTFIAAYVIAKMLDFLNPEDLSIESLVLKLSIQRPKMVYTEEQYLLLYQFVDYYMEQKEFLNVSKRLDL